MHAADVHYRLDCWLVHACLPSAIATAITTFLVCNRPHRWLDIAITNMYAGPVQVYQACMLVGTSLQNDMTAGYMQLLKTWEMAGCNCYRHG